MQYHPAYELLGKVELFIPDGAGTIFDPSSKVPAYAFQNAFKAEPYGLDVRLPLIEKYMGMSKRDHIQRLLGEQTILSQFEEKFRRNPGIKDVDALYESFKQMLYTAATGTEEISDVKDALLRLKERKIKIIMTTGYDGRMVEETIKKLPWLRDALDGYVTSDKDVFGCSEVISKKEGRPFPYMIYHAMEMAKVETPSHVIVADDTIVGLQAADNASTPGIGVLTGSVKSREEYEQKLDRKHLVVDSVADVVKLIESGEIVDAIKNLNIS